MKITEGTPIDRDRATRQSFSADTKKQTDEELNESLKRFFADAARLDKLICERNALVSQIEGERALVAQSEESIQRARELFMNGGCSAQELSESCAELKEKINIHRENLASLAARSDTLLASSKGVKEAAELIGVLKGYYDRFSDSLPRLASLFYNFPYDFLTKLIIPPITNEALNTLRAYLNYIESRAEQI